MEVLTQKATLDTDHLLSLASQMDLQFHQTYVRQLCRCLDGGPDSKATLYATWALGNLLVDSPTAQVRPGA